MLYLYTLQYFTVDGICGALLAAYAFDELNSISDYTISLLLVLGGCSTFL